MRGAKACPTMINRIPMVLLSTLKEIPCNPEANTQANTVLRLEYT